jgi:hypothetical protein
MMQTFCLDSQKYRDDGICMLLFTVREAFQESLGFSPFELVFGHSVGGSFWKKHFCENTVISILLYVEYFRHKFTRACEIEHDNLKQSQDKMKHWYGNKVIVVLLIHCHSLQAKYFWPYVIESRLNDLIYILNTHTNRKKRQIWQVITQGFSKEYKLTVDASDVGVCAVFFKEGKDDIDLPNCYFFLKHWQRSEKIIHNWKKMTCLIFIFEAIMMYISYIRGVRSQYRHIY